MTWQLIARRYPIAGGTAGHLYFDVLNDNGARVKQIHGFATDPITGETYELGSTTDLIKVYVYENGGGYNDPTHETQFLWSGLQSDIDSAIQDIKAAEQFINAQNFNYEATPGSTNDTDGFGGKRFNSNSVFNTLLNVFKSSLTISQTDADEAINMGNIAILPNHPNPGAKLDILHNMGWSRNTADADYLGSIVQGTTLADVIYAPKDQRNKLSGNDGDDKIYGGTQIDELFGGRGNDLLTGGNGNDVLSGGENNDQLYGEGGNDSLFDPVLTAIWDAANDNNDNLMNMAQCA